MSTPSSLQLLQLLFSEQDHPDTLSDCQNMAFGRHQEAEVAEVASVSHRVTANEASLPIDWNALELGPMYI